MNTQLQTTYKEYPDTLTASHSRGHATCLRYSPSGNYLAVGLVDGAILLWHVDSNQISRILRGHTRTVQSVSWSKDSRYLLSASRDWKAVLWDCLTGDRVRVVHFEAPLYAADLTYRGHWMFVTSLLESDPYLVHVEEGKKIRKEKLPNTILTSDNTQPQDTDEREKNTLRTVVCLFNKDSESILTGTTKGYINVIKTDSCELLQSIKITQNSMAIKGLRLSPSGLDLVINATDRIIRTMSSNLDLSTEKRYQDIINRLQWNACSFSSNGEYVIAATYGARCDMYIWERGVEGLVKILDGPREELVDVDWHPWKPIVSAVGLDTGSMHVWGIRIQEGWGAFAPDFQELEDNVEYHEKEDEFELDFKDMQHSANEYNNGDTFVDVLTIERLKSDEGVNFPFVLEDDEDVYEDLRNQRSVKGWVYTGPVQTKRKSNAKS